MKKWSLGFTHSPSCSFSRVGIFFLNCTPLIVFAYLSLILSRPGKEVFDSVQDSELNLAHGNSAHVSQDIHLGKICGNWQEEYSKLHEQAVLQNRKNGYQNFLIFSSCGRGIECGGTGDNLVAALSAFMLAIMYDRAFFIEWKELTSTEALIPSTFDWRMKNIQLNENFEDNTYPTQFNKHCELVTKGSNTSAEMNFFNYVHDFNTSEARATIFECMGKLSNYTTVRIHVNRGLSYWALSEKDMYYGKILRSKGFTDPYISGCLLRNLFKPGKKLLQRISAPLKQLQETDKLKICIHSRLRKANDTEFATNGAGVQEFMADTDRLLKCAQGIYDYWGQEFVGTLWFFMSGSKKVKEVVKDRYKDKVLISDIEPLHSDLTADRELALQSTLEDWYLFSQCHFFVFHPSGMSKTAAAYAMRPHSMFEVQGESLCHPYHPTIPLELGISWSGL